MALKLVMVLALCAFAIGGKLSQQPRTGNIKQLSQAQLLPKVKGPPSSLSPPGGAQSFFYFFQVASFPYVLK